MKKTMKELMTNPTVLTIIGVLLILVAVYYGLTAAVVTGVLILGAAALEVVLVFGAFYGVRMLVEWIRERKSEKEDR